MKKNGSQDPLTHRAARLALPSLAWSQPQLPSRPSLLLIRSQLLRSRAHLPPAPPFTCSPQTHFCSAKPPRSPCSPFCLPLPTLAPSAPSHLYKHHKAPFPARLHAVPIAAQVSSWKRGENTQMCVTTGNREQLSKSSKYSDIFCGSFKDNISKTKVSKSGYRHHLKYS